MTPSDVKIVAENINDFIEVPDGINRLRKAVLTLALSGQLVPQDISEGTAEQLYSQIQEKRRELEKSGVIKKAKELPPVDSEQLPFEIPKSWKWIRLGSVVNVQTGTLDANAANPNGDYPFFTCADEPLKINRYAYDCECVLLAGNGNFNVKYYKGKFEAYQRTYIIEASNDGLFVPFLFYLVQSQTDRFKASSLGSAMPYIRLGYVTEAVVALPPYAEQKRIVEKVQSVMKQLDELESQKNECDLVRSRLTRSVMQALSAADSKIAFEQLTELIKTLQDIKELESAILTLAVSGKIVPSKSKDLRVAQFSDKDLLSIVDGDRGTNYPSKSEFTNEGYCLFLNTSNVRKGKFNFSKCDFITKEKDELLRKGKLVREDIVLTTRGTIGNTAYFSSDIPFDNMRINSGMVILRCDVTKIFPPYLITFLNSSLFISQTNKLMSGSAQQQLPIRVLNQVIFPLPSLLEQKEIVKKVESLMELIARLKSTLDTK